MASDKKYVEPSCMVCFPPMILEYFSIFALKATQGSDICCVRGDCPAGLICKICMF